LKQKSPLGRPDGLSTILINYIDFELAVNVFQQIIGKVKKLSPIPIRR
jgi:hypothetical protein